MSTDAAVQPSLFDDLHDPVTGTRKAAPVTAGQQMGTAGSVSSSTVPTPVAAGGLPGKPTTVRAGGRAGTRPVPVPGAARSRRVFSATAEEWGRRQALAAPVWSREKRRRVAALLGLVLADDRGG
ncbi:hypothetical protein ThrDRAFT_03952 [Frankia casuarinae]|uniref:Uncharacterized protein n=1 Tax=Frankia casuarinae (strain DSM 45818 / CECT 9043 / HFP020203 / CcI3) TaxID=106370 RepID=Q2J5G9_FRACC|nr:hypothetical protein [Frankia casuarinae]ABD13473.1 hypothetical protein Francci3_4125 [Frankia casuarinae]EYT90436.1 hypothetical protein ThrDRAFT_03952 [Frankia casuarinae]